MVTLGLISMTLQAEERAKHLEQNLHSLAEEMQHTIPSEKPTSRWLAAIGNVVARLGRKGCTTLSQPTVPACCAEGHSCAHA